MKRTTQPIRDEEEALNAILSKNRLVRDIKQMYRGMNIPESIKFDFEAIEAAIGTMNQPTARDILESEMDI